VGQEEVAYFFVARPQGGPQKITPGP